MELDHETDFARRIAQLEEALTIKPGEQIRMHAPLLLHIRDAIKAHHNDKHKEGYATYALDSERKHEWEKDKIKGEKFHHKEVDILPLDRPKEPEEHTIAHDYIGHIIAQPQ